MYSHVLSLKILMPKNALAAWNEELNPQHRVD